MKVFLGAVGGAMVCLGFCLCPENQSPQMDILGRQAPHLWWLVIIGLVFLTTGGALLILSMIIWSTIEGDEPDKKAEVTSC